MKANWKKILMGGILLSFRGFTYCLWWRRKTKAENESGSANKAAGDVKLWVDTEYMGVFKKLSPILKKKTPILKLT